MVQRWLTNQEAAWEAQLKSIAHVYLEDLDEALEYAIVAASLRSEANRIVEHADRQRRNNSPETNSL